MIQQQDSKPIEPREVPLPKKSWKLPALALFIFSLGILPYWGSLNGDFLYDDIPYIQSNPQVRDPDWTLVFTESLPPDQPNLGLYRPLPVLTYRWQGGPGKTQSPTSYKTANALLHASLAVLVWIAAMTIGFGRSAALIAGSLFALHPIHIEAVSWIVGRAELMATLFCLLALMAHRKIKKPAFQWPIVGSFVFLGALCKENALAFPAILIAVTIIEPRKPWRVIGEVLSYALVVAVLFAIRIQVLGRFAPDSHASSFAPGSWLDRATLSIDLLSRYLQLLVWPFSPRVFFHRSEFGSLGAIDIIFIVALLASIWIALIRRMKPYFIALAWIPISLVTVVHIVPIQETLAERFLYLPSIGFCLVIGGLFGAWIDRERAKGGLFLSVVCLVAIAAAYGGTVMHRAPDFRNSVALWEDAVKVTPQFPYPHFNLAIAYENAKILEARSPERRGAVAEYVESLKIDPRHRFAAEAHERIGKIFFERATRGRGSFDDAVREYREAIRLNPTLVQALLGLASCRATTPELVSESEEILCLTRALPLVNDEGLRARILERLNKVD